MGYFLLEISLAVFLIRCGMKVYEVELHIWINVIRYLSFCLETTCEMIEIHSSYYC
jgi:hypothetical protein